MSVKIGCCGFPVAKNRYYRAFSVVELQKTFYQPPKLSTVQRWRDEAPPEFEFTLKAWQLITHQPTSPTYRRLRVVIPKDKRKNYGFFKPTDEVFFAWEKIDQICQILKAKVVVFQCPASFTPTREHKDNLKRFFSSIKRRNYHFVWEPRGEWNEKDIRDLCGELNLIWCVDPFKDRPLKMRINYFRLHGKGGYRYRYTDEDLRSLREMYSEDSLFYYMFNNVYMFEDAHRLFRLFRHRKV
ncbi:MAG TPA: DUF72 domain-containing protein [Candidatus Aerophobetes bacterium]|nr:DUF72 domain-containing protein [Candidatus Aerophobetes bacterium]